MLVGHDDAQRAPQREHPSTGTRPGRPGRRRSGRRPRPAPGPGQPERDGPDPGGLDLLVGRPSDRRTPSMVGLLSSGTPARYRDRRSSEVAEPDGGSEDGTQLPVGALGRQTAGIGSPLEPGHHLRRLPGRRTHGPGRPPGRTASAAGVAGLPPPAAGGHRRAPRTVLRLAVDRAPPDRGAHPHRLRWAGCCSPPPT